MQSGLSHDILVFIHKNIFLIIYMMAAAELYLVAAIYFLVKQHESRLMDAADNLLKGFKDAPDRDTTAHSHERISAVLQYISNKINANPATKAEFRSNAGRVTERAAVGNHYKIEMFASVMSTMVQVFPLMGILGTVLAIANTAFEPGSQLDQASLSAAFVLAMDGTILGLGFAVIFMIIESTYAPKIYRVIHESEEYRRILSNIYHS